MQAFHRRVMGLPQVLECHSLTGEADYLLKVAVTDLKALADFMSESLMKAPELATIRSSIVLESVKESNTYDVTDGGR
jgi:Lrp/AsnC family leucine-responsive transcriptional regulator